MRIIESLWSTLAVWDGAAIEPRIRYAQTADVVSIAF